MNFTEPSFLILFPVVFATYLLLQGRLVWQNRFLLIASYAFYAWFDPRFCLLLLYTTAVDYYAALVIFAKPHVPGTNLRRMTLWMSVGNNLLVLGFFKYFNFFAANVHALALAVGLDFPPFMLNIILPAGISFYTFQSISYVVDVYDEKMTPTTSFVEFALAVSYFPHLVAGPIIRSSYLLPRLQNARLLFAEKIQSGALLALYGYFLKIVIADNMAPIADRYFSVPAPRGTDVLLGCWAFAFQIYADFLGYTNIARGISRMMGIELPLNFNLPYLATNPTEFWRRWHISLSTWLRDYLYIKLGGNRGTKRETIRNLMVTMLLGGLWHGASWNFVLWGFYHGALLSLYHLWGRRLVPSGALHWLAVAVYFHITLYGWLIFRSNSLYEIAGRTRSLLMRFSPTEFIWTDLGRVALVAAGLFAFEIYQQRKNEQEPWLIWSGAVRFAWCFLLLTAIIQLSPNRRNPFIYFQF